MTASPRNKTDHASIPDKLSVVRPRLAWFFSLLILAMVGMMLAWNAHIRYQEFEDYQTRLVEGSTTGAANEIGVFLSELQRTVHLFADTQRTLLDRIEENPADQEATEALSIAIRHHFPESFAFSLANNKGEPLLDDFDGLVGEICVNDMRTFVTQQEHSRVYIHPNPVAYHFDIMVDRERSDGRSAGLFFVSFTTEILSRILKHGEVPGHKLLLLKQDIPGLIEITSEGVRIKLQREFKLSTQEMDRISHSVSVRGTSWDLVDLPDPDLYTNMRRNILREAVLIMLAFIVVNGSMLWLLLRSQAKRRKLEHLYHHDHVTGLPNRHLFLERFEHLANSHADSGSAFTLLFIDIGRFRKLKNTFFEQSVDDAFIKAAGERIEKVLCGARIVARIDDKNFAVLFSDRTSAQVESDIQNVLAALRKPFGLENDTYLPKPCVSYAQYPRDGTDIHALMRDAGAKIYAAKQQDRDMRIPQIDSE